MKNSPTIINRGRLTYVLYPDKVIVGTSLGQWISYNQYNNYNKQGIVLLRNKILKSNENEYDNSAEQLSLASQCSVIGTGTSKPKEIE